jgi:ArsR family metal-binding transcriptional regulator
VSALIIFAIVFIGTLFVNYIAKSNWLNSPDKVLVDLDENIGIKMGVISRLFNMSPLIISKNNIIKIQYADCISLFYASGHSIDIWPSNNELEEIFNKAKILLPNAEVSIIAS